MAKRRKAGLTLAFAAALALSGCGGQAMLEPDQKEAPDAGLASLFHTADPQSARQLVDGFYAPEAFGRWTKPKFSLVLAVPHSPPLQDPALLVKLFVPDNEMAQVKSLSLACSVNGVALAPETFTAPGGQVYARSLPAAALSGDRLSGDRLRADFTLDKWMPGTKQDPRDLGIVVTVVALKNGVSSGL
jgi:hypothetical protein